MGDSDFKQDDDLTNQFHTQNEFFKKWMNYSTTNASKSNYVSEQTDQMIYINFYLFIVYYVVLSVFCIFFYYNTNIISSFYARIGIMIVLYILPFVIVRIEKYIYAAFLFFRDMLYSNAYLNSKY